MAAQFQVTDELKYFLNKPVGWVKVNKKYVHHNSSYECAAWWEDSEIQSGIYPLILEQRYHHPKDLGLYAKLDAVVVDDYFPALWGGVRVSREPYQPKNVGDHRIIWDRYDIVDTIERTGNSPDADKDFCLHPFLWDAMVRSAEQTMQDFYQYLNQSWNKRASEGDDQYRSSLSAIAYAGQNVEKLARAIELIRTRQRYISENFMRDMYARNTEWVLQSA